MNHTCEEFYLQVSCLKYELVVVGSARPSQPATSVDLRVTQRRHFVVARRECRTRTTLNLVFWWFGAVAPPVLIPNTAVKRSSGDDSLYEAKVACRQNRGFNGIINIWHLGLGKEDSFMVAVLSS